MSKENGPEEDSLSLGPDEEKIFRVVLLDFVEKHMRECARPLLLPEELKDDLDFLGRMALEIENKMAEMFAGDQFEAEKTGSPEGAVSLTEDRDEGRKSSVDFADFFDLPAADGFFSEGSFPFVGGQTDAAVNLQEEEEKILFVEEESKYRELFVQKLTEYSEVFFALLMQFVDLLNFLGGVKGNFRDLPPQQIIFFQTSDILDRSQFLDDIIKEFPQREWRSLGFFSREDIFFLERQIAFIEEKKFFIKSEELFSPDLNKDLDQKKMKAFLLKFCDLYCYYQEILDKLLAGDFFLSKERRHFNKMIKAFSVCIAEGL